MSASFPQSWEPYGSSQQALNWRRVATRPSQTFNSRSPPVPRWTQPQASHPFASHAPSSFNFPSSAPTQPPSASPPAQPPSAPPGLSVSLQRHESEARLLARYEALRSDVRNVAQRVSGVESAMKEGEERAEKRFKGVVSDLAGIRGVCERLRHDLRREDDKGVERELIGAVEKRVNEVVKSRMEGAEVGVREAMRDAEKVIVGAVEKAVEKRVESVMERALERAVERILGEREAEVREAEGRARRDEGSVYRDGKVGETAGKEREQSSDSNDLYAIQVANRERPPRRASSSSHGSNQMIDLFASQPRMSAVVMNSTAPGAQSYPKRGVYMQKMVGADTDSEGTLLFGQRDALPWLESSNSRTASCSTFQPPNMSESSSGSTASAQSVSESQSELECVPTRGKSRSRRKYVARGRTATDKKAGRSVSKRGRKRSAVEQRTSKQKDPRAEIFQSHHSEGPVTRSRTTRMRRRVGYLG